jgi:hypothetical protein
VACLDIEAPQHIVVYIINSTFDHVALRNLTIPLLESPQRLLVEKHILVNAQIDSISLRLKAEDESEGVILNKIIVLSLASDAVTRLISIPPLQLTE